MKAKVYKYMKVYDTPDGLFGETLYSEHKLTTEEQSTMEHDCGLMGLLYRGRVNVAFEMPQEVVEYEPVD